VTNNERSFYLAASTRLIASRPAYGLWLEENARSKRRGCEVNPTNHESAAAFKNLMNDEEEEK
jgi:hypothetical protein